MKLMRRLTGSHLPQDPESNQTHIKNLGLGKQLKKGFVIILDKPYFYDGETIRGKIYCNMRNLIKNSKLKEVNLKFKVLEYFQVVTHHQDFCWGWGELNHLKTKKWVFWKPGNLKSLVDLCVLAINKIYSKKEIKKMNIPTEVKDKILMKIASFSTKIPFGFPPSMRSPNSLGTPSFEYKLIVELVEEEQVIKEPLVMNVEVLNYIPPVTTQSPIFSQNHRTLQLASYKEGDTLYSGNSITININNPKMELKELKVKVIQRIILKRHPNVPKDYVSQPSTIQVCKFGIKDITEVSEGVYQINLLLNFPTGQFSASYKRHKGSVRIVHVIVVKSGKKQLGEIPVTISNAKPPPELEEILGPKRPSRFTRSIHDVENVRSYYSKWDPMI